MFEDEIDDLQDDAEESAPPARQSKKETEPVVNWEAKYNGLKGTAVKHQRRAEKLAADLAQLQAKYEEDVLTLSTERDTFKTSAATLEKEATQKAQEAARLAKTLEIGRVIRKEYEPLADLFDRGLLRGIEEMEGDDLTNYLKEYAETLGQTADKRIKDAASGAKPTPPPPSDRKPPVTDTNEAKLALAKALREHGIQSPEYQEAMQIYQKTLLGG